MYRALLALAAAVALVAAAACESSDGRALPPPPDGVTAPPASLDPPEDDEPFALTSPDVDDGGVLAQDRTCHGLGLSPALAWGQAPPAAGLALVARAQDEGGGLRWVVGGIDPAIQGIGAGGLPEGAVEAVVAPDHPGWLPPCPAEGEIEAVAVVLHVLPEPVLLEVGTPAEEAAGLIEGTSTETAVLLLVAQG